MTDSRPASRGSESRPVHDLDRFVRAQDDGGTYRSAVRELREGRKQSHSMWFVFPQVLGLGHSAMSQRYAISGLEEARAYLAHPVLGQRLRDCVDILLSLPGDDPVMVFGGIDATKLRSSMTLFAAADLEEDSVFAQVLAKYFGGQPDEATVQRLG
ncbi:MAG: DUF1810 domain-containing protein [Actinomycetales bacterium]